MSNHNNNRDISRYVIFTLLVSVVVFFAYQKGKSVGSTEKENIYISKIKGLNDEISSLNNKIVSNKAERKLLFNQISTIKHQRDSLIVLKRKIKIIHDGKIDIINNANNNDIVELFAGYNKD